MTNGLQPIRTRKGEHVINYHRIWHDPFNYFNIFQHFQTASRNNLPLPSSNPLPLSPPYQFFQPAHFMSLNIFPSLFFFFFFPFLLISSYSSSSLLFFFFGFLSQLKFKWDAAMCAKWPRSRSIWSRFQPDKDRQGSTRVTCCAAKIRFFSSTTSSSPSSPSSSFAFPSTVQERKETLFYIEEMVARILVIHLTLLAFDIQRYSSRNYSDPSIRFRLQLFQSPARSPNPIPDLLPAWLRLNNPLNHLYKQFASDSDFHTADPRNNTTFPCWFMILSDEKVPVPLIVNMKCNHLQIRFWFRVIYFVCLFFLFLLCLSIFSLSLSPMTSMKLNSIKNFHLPLGKV